MVRLLIFQVFGIWALLGSYSHVLGIGVTLNPPTPRIVYEGGMATFAAFGSKPVTSITWTVNGRSLNLLTEIIATTTEFSTSIHQLILTNISTAYNNSVIQCKAVIDGANFNCSPDGQLFVQGTLGPVEDLISKDVADSSVNVSWSPPFALTVTGSGPMRYYCVEVVNLTNNVMSTIQSIRCNRSEDMNEQTSILVEDVRCGVHYNVTITPFNMVGDGRPSSISLPGAAEVMTQVNYTQVTSTSYSYTISVSGLVCSCSAIANNMQLTCAVINPGLIEVNTGNIAVNMKFSASVTVNNIVTSTSKSFGLSTFDVSNLIVTESGNNYTVEFATNSRALGVLIIFFSNTPNTFNQSIYFVQGKAEAQNMSQFPVMANGSYTASVYDVEENGEITTSAAVEDVTFIVSRQSNDTSSLSKLNGISCTSVNDDLKLNVTCDFNTTLYRGFTAFLLSENKVLASASSSVTGSSVMVAASSEGTHIVFVFPIWSNGAIPAGQLKPAFDKTIQLISTTTSTTDSPDTSNLSGGSSSLSDNTESATTSNIPPGVRSQSGNMELTIGVTIAVILLVIIIVITILIVVLCWFIIKHRKKTSVSVNMANESLMMDEKDRRSPSDTEMIAPVYESARLPPPKVVPDEVKANGESGVPAPDNPAPDAPAPVVADLYAVVDKSSKTKPKQKQEQQYEEVQIIRKSSKDTKEVEDIHKVEYASLQHQDPNAPKVNNEVPPPIPARPEGAKTGKND